MDHRTEQMERVATQMDTIVKENGRRDDITITYCEMDAESIADFTDWCANGTSCSSAMNTS